MVNPVTTSRGTGTGLPRQHFLSYAHGAASSSSTRSGTAFLRDPRREPLHAGATAGEGTRGRGQAVGEGARSKGVRRTQMQAQVRLAIFLLFPARSLSFSSAAHKRFPFLRALFSHASSTTGLPGDTFRAKAVLGDTILTCGMAAMTPAKVSP
jgi:hypothetical protein